jgi:hypothetical protein
LGRESSCDCRGILVSHVTPARCFRGINDSAASDVVEYHAEPLRIYSTTPWHALLLLDDSDPRRMSGIRNPLGDHIMSKNTPIPTTRRLDVFVVEDYTKDGEEKANWVRVGVAFENKDGKGFNVQLTALPVGGKLVMRVHEPRPGA